VSQLTIDNLSRRRLLKAGGIGLLGAMTFPIDVWSRPAEMLTLYVGTYTSGKSEGIYLYRMNSLTGELTRVNAFKTVNPSFLAIDRSKRYLYAVNEVSQHLGAASGRVSAFAIEAGTGNLRLLNEQATQGADPCYLTIDRKRKTLLVANYTGGSIAALPIRSDGTLGMAIDVKQHEGSSLKEQQKGPHAHCVILDRFERYALAADLGTDKVMIYRFNPLTGKLIPGQQPWTQLQAGAGPRHLVLHPKGKYAYVINELDSTLTVLKYNEAHGTLTHVETVSTLPADFSGVSYCADVHVSPSGKFLYGSNRGHNSIVVFRIDQRTGKLKQVQHVSTEGKWPRNFALDPAGNFLLVANQQTDNVVVFRIAPQTGLLTLSGQSAEIPVPVCLKFI
jgi:6-phosphogluconolactonase